MPPHGYVLINSDLSYRLSLVTVGAAIVRLRCPAGILGPKAFVSRRPLHPLRLCFIRHWRRKGSRPPAQYLQSKYWDFRRK